MNARTIIAAATLTLSIGFSEISVAQQCKELVDKNVSQVSPYILNGQLNSATINQKQKIEFQLFFYKGLNYKVFVASDENLGSVEYRVLDGDKNEVYNSKTGGAGAWVFNVATSQDLVFEVVSTGTDVQKKGCVAVIVGFQQHSMSSSRMGF